MKDIFLRRILIALTIAAFLGSGALALAMTVTFEPYGVPDLRKKDYEQKVRQIKARSKAMGSKAPRPVAVVEESSHDFGLMDPLTEGTHSFKIRNDGDETLVLTGGETTCKCTLLEGKQQVIAPGDTSEITLFWNTGRKRESYKQNAHIRTNDPLKPELTFTVKGRVRFELATSDNAINFNNLSPDGEAKHTLEVYSQLFEDFELAKIESTLEELVWSVDPMIEEELKRRDAKSGYRLNLRMPLDKIDRRFAGVVRVYVNRPEASSTNEQALNSEEASSRRPSPELDDGPNEPVIMKEIPISGSVPGRLSVVGSGLHRDSGFDFGLLKKGQPHQRILFLRVRGEREPEILKIKSVSPAFVTATISPSKRERMYRLDLVINDDAPQHIFNTALTRGKIEIACDLMGDGVLTLPISGAVLP